MVKRNNCQIINIKMNTLKMRKFKAWCFVYEDYLIQMHNIVNEFKGKNISNIEFKEFVVFLFNNSSQYISPYIK